MNFERHGINYNSTSRLIDRAIQINWFIDWLSISMQIFWDNFFSYSQQNRDDFKWERQLNERKWWNEKEWNTVEWRILKPNRWATKINAWHTWNRITWTHVVSVWQRMRQKSSSIWMSNPSPWITAKTCPICQFIRSMSCTRIWTNFNVVVASNHNILLKPTVKTLFFNRTHYFFFRFRFRANFRHKLLWNQWQVRYLHFNGFHANID